MAVNTTDIKTALLACNGVTTTFPFSFKILEDSDLKVYLITSAGVRTLLTLTSDYAVSAVNDDFSEGGNVETVATYASGNQILIVRAVTNKQESDYTHGDDLPADTLEDDFDRRCMVEQEHGEHLTRALCFPVEDDDDLDPELPPKADRLGKYLYFDGTYGEPTMVDILEPAGALSVTDFAKTILDDEDPVEVLKTLSSIKTVASTDYIVLDDDGYTVINVTTGAVDRTITLPTAAANVGRVLKVRKVDDGAGYVINDGEGAETINDTTLWYLFNQYDYVVVECDGTEWFVIGGTEPGLEYQHDADWAQETPTQHTWYGVTNFLLALPTGGEWEVDCFAHFGREYDGVIAITCATTTATEDDEKYSIRAKSLTVNSTIGAPMSKRFRRTLTEAATLYISVKTLTAGAASLLITDALANGYIRAKRIR